MLLRHWTPCARALALPPRRKAEAKWMMGLIAGVISLLVSESFTDALMVQPMGHLLLLSMGLISAEYNQSVGKPPSLKVPITMTLILTGTVYLLALRTAVGRGFCGT